MLHDVVRHRYASLTTCVHDVPPSFSLDLVLNTCTGSKRIPSRLSVLSAVRTIISGAWPCGCCDYSLSGACWQPAVRNSLTGCRTTAVGDVTEHVPGTVSEAVTCAAPGTERSNFPHHDSVRNQRRHEPVLYDGVTLTRGSMGQVLNDLPCGL
jgi:hypothetical protein